MVRLYISDTELLLLAELAYIGNNVINGSRLPDEQIEAYSFVAEKIVKRSGRKFEGIVDYNRLDDLFFSRLSHFFDDFIQSELKDSLADSLSREQRLNGRTINEARDEIFNELQENGFKNVSVNITGARHKAQGGVNTN